MSLLGTSLKRWMMVCHIYFLFNLKCLRENQGNDDIEQNNLDMQSKQEITPFMAIWHRDPGDAC